MRGSGVDFRWRGFGWDRGRRVTQGGRMRVGRGRSRGLFDRQVIYMRGTLRDLRIRLFNVHGDRRKGFGWGGEERGVL